MALPMPSGIRAAQIDTSQLKAYLRVDGNARLPMTISPSGDRVERSVTLNVGQHTFVMEFELAQDQFGNPNVRLADSSMTFNVKKGNNVLQFQDSQYRYDSKPCDSDGYTNLLEISKGSDPCDETSTPDVTAPITSVSPLSGSYFGSVEVTLSCSDGSGVGCKATYYTLDNSDPSVNSPQYSTPLVLTANTTLKFLSVDTANNMETAQTANFTVVPPPSVAGIWWLKNSPAKPDPVYSNTLCSLGTFNPRFSVSQNNVSLSAADDSGVQYTGSIDDAQGHFTLNGTKSWIDAGNASVTIIETLSGQFISSSDITASMTRSVSVGGGPATCSEANLQLAGAVTFQHSGQNYSGIYGVEDIHFNGYTATSPLQEAIELQIDIQDTMANIYAPGAAGILTGSYDASKGSFNLIQTYDTPNVDEDGDGVADDLRHQVQLVDGLFVGPPDSTGSTNMAGVHIDYQAVFLNTAVYNPLQQPDRVERGIGHFYGRPVTTAANAKTVLVPEAGLGSGSVQSYRLGLSNPPLKHNNTAGQLSINVVDQGNSVVCSATFANRYRQITYLPHVDFKTEQVQDGGYGEIECDVDAANPLNTAANYYNVNIMENGTSQIASYPLTAPAAVFPTQRPSYRTVNVNGAKASQTQPADPLPLSGYFNFNEALPINWPPIAGTPTLTLQNYELQLFRQDEPNRQYRLISASNNTTLPQNGLLQSLLQYNNSAVLRLVANMTTTNNESAQSVSRGLQIRPALYGLFNVELAGSTTGVLVGQLALNSANTMLPNVNCVVTRAYDPTNVICSGGQVDWLNNRFTATITDNSTVPPQTFAITSDFNDSTTSDVTITSGPDTAAGQGKIVNTELAAYSVLGVNEGTVWSLTAVDVKNPNPYFDRGRLLSANGQNLGNGSNNPLTLWNSTGSYITVYSSYEILPLDGVQTQTFMTNVAFRSAALLNPDTFTAELTNTSQPNDVENFTFDYQGANPAVMFLSGQLPPARTQFSINGVPITGDSGTQVNPILLTQSTPFTVAWADTTTADSNVRPNLQWRLRVFLQASRHDDRRSPWLSEQELTVNGSSLGWTVPVDLIRNFSGNAVLNLRIRDSANTMRGASDNIYLQFNP